MTVQRYVKKANLSIKHSKQVQIITIYAYAAFASILLAGV